MELWERMAVNRCDVKQEDLSLNGNTCDGKLTVTGRALSHPPSAFAQFLSENRLKTKPLVVPFIICHFGAWGNP